MRFLFVHQNFPGQFRHIVVALAAQGHQVFAFGEKRNLDGRKPLHPDIQYFVYEVKHSVSTKHSYLRNFEAHVLRGQAVAMACFGTAENDIRPDVVVAHPGWGEALFLKDIYPNARHIHFCEYFYRFRGGDIAFDPEFPSTLDEVFRLRIKNATQLVGLEYADAFVSPTLWQRSRFPESVRPLIEVIHEGIDTKIVKPEPTASVRVDGLTLSAKDEVVTYIARNLEPHRGFHILMKMLPKLLEQRPQAHVLIIGGDEVSYGLRPKTGGTWREHLYGPLRDQIDTSRVHIVGRIPYHQFLMVLQISSVHLYLTYPFVLSWSMLEAMAAECLVIGSSTAPVRECLLHGHNGLLCDFFDVDAWVATIVEALKRRHELVYTEMRRKARKTVVRHFDLHGKCLPRYINFLTGSKQAT
jgi:glycosyltransferase involved in cell wall biosynthesis